jgi:L-fuculose-phosphate aldolase
MSDPIKQQLVDVAKLAYNKGMVNTYEGNLSVRNNEKVYITPSSVCKGLLSEEMIIVTDLSGNILEGNLKPSSEVRLHLLTYLSRCDIGAVVHAHAPYTTAYAVANKPIETKAYPEMIVLFDKIPVAQYGTPSTNEIFKGIEKYISSYDAILLANHGIMTLGKSIYDAFFKLEAAESIAKVLTLAKILGGEKDLPANKLEELYALRGPGGKG